MQLKTIYRVVLIKWNGFIQFMVIISAVRAADWLQRVPEHTTSIDRMTGLSVDKLLRNLVESDEIPSSSIPNAGRLRRDQALHWVFSRKDASMSDARRRQDGD